MRFREGLFCNHKQMWRSYAIDGWNDYNMTYTNRISTVFEFNNKGKVSNVTRNLDKR